MERKDLRFKTFAHKGRKIAASNKFFAYFFIHLFAPFKRLLPPLPKVQYPNFLDFQNPWGKVIEKNALRFENFCI